MCNSNNDLKKNLWNIANMLRGKMNADEYKNYILGFIFFKFLSENMQDFADDLLINDKESFSEAVKNEKFLKILQKESVLSLGYFIEPKYLFDNIVNQAKNSEPILGILTKSFQNIERSALNQKSEQVFSGLFNDIDLTSLRLGRVEKDRNRLISDILIELSTIDFKLHETNQDILGNAYEFLIGEFASGAGKKAGEFYTPAEVSQLLAKIVTLNRQKVKSVYDPTCGSGSLLLKIGKECEVSNYYGQELNLTTYNLVRMNMILHKILYNHFDIKQGDTLEDPQHIDKKFDIIVANPPFSAHWSASPILANDERFASPGKLAPKTKADYAFLLHMLYHLEENGTMAIILPHGVLFRGSTEGVIRKFLLENNYIDTVIGLPANIFFGTSIPTSILILKKDRTRDDNTLFIDASNEFENGKNQNKLRTQDIDKIFTTFMNRSEIEKYSHLATLSEIEENDYNLNIPRYVDTFEEEEPINLDEVVTKIQTNINENKDIDALLKDFTDELGISTSTLSEDDNV